MIIKVNYDQAQNALPAGFAAAWAANHAKFPRGIDLILCAGTEIAALPRSVRITSAMKEA